MSMIDETFEFQGRTFKLEADPDYDMEKPWDWCDGHGDVSEWTHRDKYPGELVLCEDRGSRRYYDFAGAMKKARAEGWDTFPYKQGTKGERAYRAVMADFEYLRRWCENDWCYVTLHVTMLDSEGEETDLDEYLGGVEAGWWIDHQAAQRGERPYYMDAAEEMASELLHRLAEEEKRERINNRFRDAMQCGL